MSATTIEKLYDREEIAEQIGILARQVEREAGDAHLLVIAVLSGAVVFLSDLIREFEQPVTFGFIQVKYSKGSGREQAIHFPLPLDLEGSTVLILKDVVTTGVTESYLVEEVRRHGASQVVFAALVDQPSKRRTDFKADFHLFSPEANGLFIGYGMDFEGRYGNLPFIGVLGENE